ncbi:MAG TPA: serine hydrolase domain-containing protein [Thermomicrobiales bacterium]|nr:serine hydrolase domain-containing protein [Thermomicrobiales bacterium]
MATQTKARGTREGADSTFSGLGEFVRETMDRLHVPGVAVGVLHDDREAAAGFGVTSVDNPLPVTADTLFQIGSITKTFTGTAAMRLVEQGKLDLDAPLRTYLPKLRLAGEGVAAGVTLRHLLTHTGGWVGDYFDDTGMGDDALRRIVTRMAKLPQLTPLGAVWSYNNAGFYLAGRALEAVAKRPYEEIIRELVFDPLGMEMSFFFPGDVMVHRFAVGHIVQDDKAAVAKPWPLARAAHPAGGIASTVDDLFRYARYQFTDGVAPDGARLLSPESTALMRAPQVAIDRQGSFVGLTWMLRKIGDVRFITHSGGTNGQITLFLVVPERRFALIVLTNANRGGEVTEAVTKWAVREYLGAEEPEPAPLAATAAQLSAYTGRYRAAMSELELTLRDGELIVQMTPLGGFPKKDSPPGPTPPPTRAALYAEDAIIALDPPLKGARGEFLRDDAGNIAWLRLGGRIARRQ